MSEATSAGELDAMVNERVAGRPLEHILGWAEFAGMRIAVEPGVFVPRRRTEFLVREAAALARRPPSQAGLIVDLCCGSGAVGAALHAVLDRVELHAVDIDPVAVRCARRNLADLGGIVYEGDLYEPLPGALGGRVEVLVANAPYVPSEELPLLPSEARIHEPRLALDGGADGLDIHRRVAAAAMLWLAPGGHLLVETSERQASETARIFGASGLLPQLASSENLDAFVVIGTSPGSL